jgi:hypothetical protein
MRHTHAAIHNIITLAIFAGAAVPATAFAAETEKASVSASSEEVTADKPAEGEKKEGEEEGPWEAEIDAVAGFGSTGVISQRVVGPQVTDEDRRAERASYTTGSFNLGLSYAPSEGWKVGGVLPIGFGSLSPNDSLFPEEKRGSTILGNVELAAQRTFMADRPLKVIFRLGLSLPTALGTDLPEAKEVPDLGHFDQRAFDRRSILQAMSNSRGREEGALYAPDHLGVNPKLGFVKTGEKTEWEAYVKYESLFATASKSKYEGSVIVFGRGTYHMSKATDLTLRAWADFGFGGEEGTTAVIEPQIRGHWGWVTPTLGVVVPVVGDLIKPWGLGARAAIAANF